MMMHMVWIFLSFFAVIGLMECILGVLELLSLRRIHSVKRVVLRVEVAGEEPKAEYLLNTLCLKADRMSIGGLEAEIEVADGGMTPETHRAVAEYCEKNPWVLFTEKPKDDII